MAKTKSAATRAVVDYDAFWDTVKNGGRISVTIQGSRPLVLKIDNANEYVAVLTLLQGQKTVFVRSDGVLTTAP